MSTVTVKFRKASFLFQTYKKDFVLNMFAELSDSNTSKQPIKEAISAQDEKKDDAQQEKQETEVKQAGDGPTPSSKQSDRESRCNRLLTFCIASKKCCLKLETKTKQESK